MSSSSKDLLFLEQTLLSKKDLLRYFSGISLAFLAIKINPNVSEVLLTMSEPVYNSELNQVRKV